MDPQFVCLNDELIKPDGYCVAHHRTHFTLLLDTFWPTPAPWEHDGAATVHLMPGVLRWMEGTDMCRVACITPTCVT